MTTRVHFFVLFPLFMLTLSSCEKSQVWFRDVNSTVFSHFGGVLGKKPPELSVKQVHLSRDDYFQRDIFVTGQVMEIAKEGTFAIIDDEEGRLMVRLSHLPLEVFQKIKAKQKIRVFGRLEYGKLGLPLLTAYGVFNVKGRA